MTSKDMPLRVNLYSLNKVQDLILQYLMINKVYDSPLRNQYQAPKDMNLIENQHFDQIAFQNQVQFKYEPQSTDQKSTLSDNLPVNCQIEENLNILMKNDIKEQLTNQDLVDDPCQNRAMAQLKRERFLMRGNLILETAWLIQ